MDYFRQRREYRKLKQNEIDISIGQNNLYRELLDYANDEGKLDDWFPLKNSALTDLTGLSTQGVAKARNSLIQMNLIKYRPGKKNAEKPQYKILPLYNKRLSKSVTTSLTKNNDENGENVPKCDKQFTSSVTAGSQVVAQTVVQPVAQTVEHKDLTSTIQELDKDNKYIYQDDLGVYEFIQQAWKKAPTGLLQGALGPWIKEWGPELVLYAFKLAYENSVEMQGLKKYVQAILNNWAKRDIKTLEDAEKAREAFEEQKRAGRGGYQKKPVREEKLPNWDGMQEDTPLSDEEQADLQRQMQELLGDNGT
ncbi:DnaD domain protein [Enterococcus faecalis]|uniref:DnaD domain-containing protein n=1 Tax=Enterococcus faecalis ATCC 6055 TaxID=1169311 RepID=R3IF68_ENTFL|nr:DnaD domain protein [Enterococcus faecalis]EOK16348.1 DnaD domain-containing protein [Enterococcus faecalis ATCC 6055]